MRLASTKNVIHTQNFLATVFKLTSTYVGIVLQVDRNVDDCNSTLNISCTRMLSHTNNLKQSILSNCNKRLCFLYLKRLTFAKNVLANIVEIVPIYIYKILHATISKCCWKLTRSSIHPQTQALFISISNIN